MSKRYLLGCFSFATAVALAGCGGSGAGIGEGGAISAEASASDRSYAPGVASKGPLTRAQATAYLLDSQGHRTEVLGLVETNDNGSYQIEFPASYSGGLVEIELAALEGKTRMTCDAERCGRFKRHDQMPVPQDFSMVAIVNPSTGHPSGSITPWSSMAAKRAKALVKANPGLFLQDALDQANSEVGQVVGLDVAATLSGDLTQLQDVGASQAQYAIMNAAAAEIIFRRDGSGDLVAEYERFISALANDGIIGRGSEGFLLGDLADAIHRVTSRTPHLDETASEIINNQVAQFELAGTQGFVPGYNPAFSHAKLGSRNERIAAFRDFFAQVRTWLSSIEASSGIDLAEAVAVDPDTVQTLVDGRTQSQFRLLGEVVHQVVTHVADNPGSVLYQLANGEKAILPISDGRGRQLGSAAVSFEDRDGLHVNLAGEVLASGGQRLPFQLELDTALNVAALDRADSDGDGGRDQLVNLLIAAQVSMMGEIEGYEDVPTLQIERLALELELNPMIAEAKAGTVHNLDVFGGISLSGDVSILKQGARFTGSVDLTLARLGVGFGENASPMSLGRFRLAGDFSSADGAHKFSASASVDVRGATAFESLDWDEGRGRQRLISGCFCGAEELFDLASPELDDAVLPGYVLQAGLGDEPRSGTIHFAGYAKRDLNDYNAYESCVADIHDLRADASAAISSDLEILREVDVSAIDDAEKWCAESLLMPIYDQQELTSQYLDRFHRHVSKRLQRKYGDEIARQTAISDFYGYAEQGARHGLFTALVELPQVGERKPVDISFTVASRVEIPELRAANVSATLTHTSYRGARLRTNVKWDGGSYTALISVDDVEKPSEIEVRLFNTQGYELNLNIMFNNHSKIESMTGKALVDGDEVGYVQLRDDLPVILYPTGNGKSGIIESLF